MTAESVPFRSENYNKIVKNKLGIQNVERENVDSNCPKITSSRFSNNTLPKKE